MVHPSSQWFQTIVKGMPLQKLLETPVCLFVRFLKCFMWKRCQYICRWMFLLVGFMLDTLHPPNFRDSPFFPFPPDQHASNSFSQSLSIILSKICRLKNYDFVDVRRKMSPHSFGVIVEARVVLHALDGYRWWTYYTVCCKLPSGFCFFCLFYFFHGFDCTDNGK